MIINIKNKKDLITADLRLKEVRYIKNFEDISQAEIIFINLNSSESESLEYLSHNKKNFLITICDFLLENDIITNLKDLEVLK